MRHADIESCRMENELSSVATRASSLDIVLEASCVNPRWAAVGAVPVSQGGK